MTDRPSGEQHVYDWPTSIAVAVGGTAAAVVLIVVFTYLVDWVGSFWSQVVYFLAVFVAVMGLAIRSRRKDDADPVRLTVASSRVTPMGLPGPFVMTQAFGVLGIAMIAVGVVIQGDRGILWAFAGYVLVLVGGVGLVTWLLAWRAPPGGRPRVIRAAGAVLHRGGLVAVVHRPQYDDWTLPKGKLDGRGRAAAAVREVEEETGHVGTIEHDLGTSATTSPRARRRCGTT